MDGGGTAYFWHTRLSSLAGVILSMEYVLLFLVPLSATGGAARGAAAGAGGLILAIKALAILIPFLLHASAGLKAIYCSQFNVIAYGSYRNWMYALQRATGILIAALAVYHIGAAKLASREILSTGWGRAVYLAGIACASFHIGNGIASALARWGITSSRRSQDVASMAMWAAAIALTAWGARVVLAFH